MLLLLIISNNDNLCRPKKRREGHLYKKIRTRERILRGKSVKKKHRVNDDDDVKMQENSRVGWCALDYWGGEEVYFSDK